MAHDNLVHPHDRGTGAAAGALVHLKDVKDFDFPKDQPDPRGWEVTSAEGTKLGKVADLLFDTQARRVRYLEVEIDKDVAKEAGRDWALVPVGAARLDDDRDEVIVDLSSTDLGHAPAYDRQALSRDYEKSLKSYLRDRPRTGAAAATRATPGTAEHDTDFYAGPEYDDRSFFGARRRGSGAADRATDSGLADRLADKVDNIKDRFDANPRSKPGPDPTDRPI